MENKLLFEESQRFTQWWLILIIVVVMLILLSVFIMRLDTQIKEDGIYVRFFPIHQKYRHYLWEDLKYVYVREYAPLGEYGGWGIKGVADDRVLNISGKEGLQLVFADGRKLLIGTKRSEEIKIILNQIQQYRPR